jgi:hypothetical protein
MLVDVEDDAWLVDRILKKENSVHTYTGGYTGRIHGSPDTFKQDLILSDHSLA